MFVGTRVARMILARLQTEMGGYTHDGTTKKCGRERDVGPVVSDSLDWKDMSALYKRVPRDGARSTTPVRNTERDVQVSIHELSL